MTTELSNDAKSVQSLLDQLDEAFLEMAEAAIQALNDRQKQGPVPGTDRYTTTFPTPNQSRTERRIVADFHYVFRNMALTGALDQQPAVDRCARLHWETGVLRLPLSPHTPLQIKPYEDVRSSLLEVLLWPVAEYCCTLESGDVDFHEMLKHYWRLKQAWTSKQVVYTDEALLINLEAVGFDDKPIEPIPGCTINNLSPDQKARYSAAVRNPFTNMRDLNSLLIHARSLITIQHTVEGFDPANYDPQSKSQHLEKLTESLRVFLLALRLHKAGDVASPFKKTTICGPFIGPITSWSSNPVPSTFTLGLGGRVYQLTSDDVADVIGFFDLLSKYETKSHYLATALQRFDNAYSRRILEEKIVDFTIAAESCLVSEIDELSYRFRLRGAALLAASDKASKWQDPKTAYGGLKDLYDARSAIVHQGKLLSELKQFKKSAAAIAPFVDECEDLTRHIIQATLRRLVAHSFALSKEAFAKSLDELILSRLQPG